MQQSKRQKEKANLIIAVVLDVIMVLVMAWTRSVTESESIAAISTLMLLCWCALALSNGLALLLLRREEAAELAGDIKTLRRLQTASLAVDLLGLAVIVVCALWYGLVLHFIPPLGLSAVLAVAAFVAAALIRRWYKARK